MMRKVAALLLLGLMSACAPKPAPAPVVTTPKYPEFLTPVVPQAFANQPAALNQDRGWRFLQMGDLKAAEREFGIALRAAPAFYPAETGLGDLELARKDPKAALAYFDRALGRAAAYTPALVGRGQALLALDRDADALAAFDAALAADPSLGDIRRRVEVLRFRGAEETLKRAREAARAGRADEAVAAYGEAIKASPDSPFLYRELADAERLHGSADAALEHYRKAVALDPGDVKSFVLIGDLLAARNDFAGAGKAYEDALALEPSGPVEAKLDAIRERAALAALPEEYRAISDAAQITRGDLAALIGVRLAPLLQSGQPREGVLITDLRNSWAAPWIMSVARAGIIDPFANHTFQPRAVVRRIDFAQAASRLLTRLGPSVAGQAKSWLSARGKFTDMSPGHLAYPAASAAVASGVMTTVDGAFQPSRPMTGAEAIRAIERLEALTGPSAGKKDGR